MIDIIASVQRQQQQSGNHPIVVHCRLLATLYSHAFITRVVFCVNACVDFGRSAGAGRTGTFIALSNILERVKAEGLLDVFQTVKSLRMQRPHMVQTVVSVSGVVNHHRCRDKCCLISTVPQPNPTFLFLPPPGAVRLLLQGGTRLCRHFLRLCQF